MESVPSMPLSANAPDGALASRADVAPPAAVHSNGAARSEPDTGGWRGACPRMVPLGEFATPPTEHLPQPGSTPYATHGPLPPLHTFAHQPPAYAAQQYPTPGVAYDPYNPMQSPYIQPQSSHTYYGRDTEVAALTAQLQAAMGEINRLSMLAAPPSPQNWLAPIQVPLAQLNVLQSTRALQQSPNRSDCGSSFDTITSSSCAVPSNNAPHVATSVAPSSRRRAPSIAESSISTEEANDALLPMPAADARAGTMSSSVHIPDVFSSKELSAMPCTCEPEDVAAWDVMVMGRLGSRKPAAAKVMRYSDEEIAAMPYPAQTVVLGYDIMLGGQLIAMLQGNTKAVRLRRATIARREKQNPGKITSSGRAIRRIIMEIVNPTYGSELEGLERALDKPFFTMTMSDTDIQLASYRLQALRAQLPPSARGGERELLRALIAKFPPELASKAAEYKTDMCKDEVRKRPYEWTYEELTAILSSHITSSSTAEVNNTEFPRGGGGGGGGGGGAFGTVDFKGCLNCGFDNHPTRKCTAPPCTYCGLRFCFGARKRGNVRSCLVKKIVEGGKVEDTDLGLNGQPLPPTVIAKLNEKATALKAKSAEVNATGVQTDSPKNVIDDDDSGAEESDHCELLLASHVCC